MASSSNLERDNNTDDESDDTLVFNPDFPETDVTLVVEDQKIHVNKAVLSQHSPVFKAMFSGNFKESTSKEIPLHDKKYTDVVEFLRCFYPNMKHGVTENNVLQVLTLAHEYQSPLVADCEKFMISMCKPDTDLTVTTLLDYILAAERFELKALLDNTIKFCAHVDFDLLNGKTSRDVFEGGKYVYKYTVNNNIRSKFLNIELKNRYKIAEKRLALERYRRKRRNSSGEPPSGDYSIPLSKEINDIFKIKCHEAEKSINLTKFPWRRSIITKFY